MVISPAVRPALFITGLACAGLMALNPALSHAGQSGGEAKGAVTAPRLAAAETGVRDVVRIEPIPFSVIRHSTSNMRTGTSVTVRPGSEGKKAVTYRERLQNGAILTSEIVKVRILKHSAPEVIEDGARTTLPSRGYFSGRHVVTMVATTYDPYHCGGSGSGRTFLGLKGGYGVVAVDPRFIPLGARLYIEGYGYAVAADTGGAIKGNRIDLGIDSNHDARAIRDMHSVPVHILD